MSYTKGARCALQVSYEARDGQRKWCVLFQNEPKQCVIFTGDTPTRQELVEAIQDNWLVGVIESVIGTIVENRSEKEKA